LLFILLLAVVHPHQGIFRGGAAVMVVSAINFVREPGGRMQFWTLSASDEMIVSAALANFVSGQNDLRARLFQKTPTFPCK
jgi:hypothetical protein